MKASHSLCRFIKLHICDAQNDLNQIKCTTTSANLLFDSETTATKATKAVAAEQQMLKRYIKEVS